MSVAVFVGDAQEWIPEVADAMGKVQPGAWDDSAAGYGPQISGAARERILGYIQIASPETHQNHQWWASIIAAFARDSGNLLQPINQLVSFFLNGRDRVVKGDIVNGKFPQQQIDFIGWKVGCGVLATVIGTATSMAAIQNVDSSAT